MLISFKRYYATQNGLNNMFFALDNTILVMDNTFAAFDNLKLIHRLY